MAAPTIRGITAPVAGGAVTSPSSTAVGDMVVVFTFERLGAGSASTLTVDSGNSYVQINNQFHNDSSTDGAFAVGYKIATSSGAQSYQAFTSSTGTPNWATGCIVLQVNTFDTTDIKSAFVSQTTNAVPNPPSVTLGSTRDWQVIVTAAWHLGSSATVTPTAPTNYTNLNHISGSDDIELAIVTRALTAAASEDPGAFGDDVAPNGTCTFTIGVSNPLPTTLTAGAPTTTVSSPTASRLATISLSAGAPTSNATAPTANLQEGGGGQTLSANAGVVTLTAPTTTRTATISLGSGAPLATVTAPAASRLATAQLILAAPTTTVTAPTASRTAVRLLTATAPTSLVTAPQAIRILNTVPLIVGSPFLTVSAPVMTKSTTVSIAAGGPTTTVTAPSAVLSLPGSGDYPVAWSGMSGISFYIPGIGELS